MNTISYTCFCNTGFNGDGKTCIAATAVLVLSTYKSTNKPMIVDFDGE